MHILASDFSGLAWIFVAIPIFFIALAGISFIPAALGHWSAVLLAAPAIVFGPLYLAMFVTARARFGGIPFGGCMLLLAPPVLGILSMGVWSERRHARGR